MKIAKPVFSRVVVRRRSRADRRIVADDLAAGRDFAELRRSLGAARMGAVRASSACGSGTPEAARDGSCSEMLFEEEIGVWIVVKAVDLAPSGAAVKLESVL